MKQAIREQVVAEQVVMERVIMKQVIRKQVVREYVVVDQSDGSAGDDAEGDDAACSAGVGDGGRMTNTPDRSLQRFVMQVQARDESHVKCIQTTIT